MWKGEKPGREGEGERQTDRKMEEKKEKEGKEGEGDKEK
jgi:hypothetical protein